MSRFVIALVLAVFVWGRAFAAVPDAAALRADILRHGAKAVVERLVASDGWDEVSDRIASGRTEWVTLAPKLADGTDAGPSEDLGIDLAFALPQNPTVVLRSINDKPWREGGIIGVERVCGAPFIEDTEPKGYLPEAIAAVQRVSDPALTNKKAACLAELHKIRN